MAQRTALQYAAELGLQAIAGYMPGPITPQRIPPRIYMGGCASFLRLTLARDDNESANDREGIPLQRVGNR